MSMLRRARAGWMELVVYIGDFQSRALLTTLYFTIVVPFAGLSRLLGDPLHLRKVRVASAWIERQTQDTDLAAVRRQF